MSGFNNTKKGLDNKCCGQSHGGYCLTCPALQKKINNNRSKLFFNFKNNNLEPQKIINTDEYYNSSEFQNMIESCSS